MAKSTQIITDTQAVAAATFTTASLAKAKVTGGENQDLTGMAAALAENAAELRRCAAMLKNGIDAADPILPTVQGIIDVCV